MKKTLTAYDLKETAYDLKEAFIKADRDYYTLQGLETLLDYYDEIDENMELDVIAICCDCTEYGDNVTCTFQDLINDYGYLYLIEQYLEDEGLSENEFNLSEYIESLVEVLEEKTSVLHVSNGNYIVFAF